MLGAGRLIATTLTGGAPPPPPPYAVSVTPSYLYAAGVKGNLRTPTCYSVVSNGVGPFTYLWTIDNIDINIDAPASPHTSFSTNDKYPAIVSGKATLTVTDAGNGNVQTSAEAFVEFEFIF